MWHELKLITGTMADVPGSWPNWHIAVACHILNFLIFGMIRISGLIFAECITHFGVDREHASLPFVLSNILKALASPLSGYLGQTLGLRPVIIAGCVLCSLGIGSCFFADNIITLAIYWGIYGLGCGMSTAIIPQVLNEYFVKHKTKANGFASAGAAVAGFVLPPVVVALLKEYGVSGSFLILTAILLHSIPAAMLLKKPDIRTPHTQNASVIQVETHAKSDGKLYCNNMHIVTDMPFTSKLMHEKSGSQPQNSQVITTGTEKVERKNIKPFQNVIKRNCNLTKQKSGKKKDSCLEIFSIFWNPIFLFIAVPKCVLMFVYNTVPMFLVDFFSDKGFSLEQSTYLLMVFSVFDLIGKLCLGFVTDNNYISRTKFAALLFTILAVSFVVMVFANGFVVMTFAMAAKALCAGGIQPLHPGLVAEYLDTGKQTMAMASPELLLLPMSASAVSLIGYFRDDMGSYSGLLLILCATGLFSSALLMGLPSFSSWWKKRHFLPIQADEMSS